MARQALIVGIVIVVVALVGSGVVVLMSSKPNQPGVSPSPSATPLASLTPILSPTAEASTTPDILTREQIRDATMNFIEANHRETAQLMSRCAMT